MTTPTTARGWLKRWFLKVTDAIAENPWRLLGLGGRSVLVVTTITVLLSLNKLIIEATGWFAAMTKAYGG